MMKYESLVEHLENNDCYIDEESYDGEGVVFINAITDAVSYVRQQPVFSAITVIKICMELSIDCPSIFEDDYAIFSSYEKVRKQQNQQ